ncbi:hypothetical protein T440DRAFT_67183 [Plenodomus tracheiphilus IPT5]|uniref:Uncharacterized protein n=1 Tax=Plenodomus tracheiphilus IPT5 TaxID=1408161 RepID=A0A6A7BA13_9PLEO|nr:hypothetical protein T440DRAFT_67183 [Plenodomus tracheiphilus IPT5]
MDKYAARSQWGQGLRTVMLRYQRIDISLRHASRGSICIPNQSVLYKISACLSLVACLGGLCDKNVLIRLVI